MNVKNFILSYYTNATDGVHIHKVKKTIAAQKPHTHEYFQIYYMIKGSLTHFVGDFSSTLHRGDMFIIPPHNQHHIKPNEPDSIFYSFSFMPDILEDCNRANRLAVNFLHHLTSISDREIHPKITIPTDETLYVESIMEHIMKEFTNKSIGNGEIIRASTVILLTTFARIYFKTAQEHISIDFETTKQSVLHCIQYIDDNFAEALSLTEVAKHFNMSKSCFCGMFSSLTGYTFNQYLNKKRIEYAVKLIQKGYKITSLYGLCGYSDFSTFSRNFKKFMGLSPTQYRKQ